MDIVSMNMSTGRVRWTLNAKPPLPSPALAPCERTWSPKGLMTAMRSVAKHVDVKCQCGRTTRGECFGRRCDLSELLPDAMPHLLRQEEYTAAWRRIQQDSPRWTSPSAAFNVRAAQSNVSFFAQMVTDLHLFMAFFSMPVKTGGTFVELGATDGIFGSNTLFFEMHLGWSGVLIEPTPLGGCVLPRTRPNARAIHAATCVEPGQIQPCDSRGATSTGGFCNSATIMGQTCASVSRRVAVPCLPMATHLSDLHEVNLMVIDVENAHWHVLLSLPWERLRIDVILIECSGLKMCMANLKTKGYRCFDHNDGNPLGDLLCVRRACLRNE